MRPRIALVALQAGLIVFDRFLACVAWMFVVSVSGRAGVRLFFFGVRIWLVMTFNYPVLWVRVKG